MLLAGAGLEGVGDTEGALGRGDVMVGVRDEEKITWTQVY